MRLALAATLLVACGRERGAAPADSARVAAPPTGDTQVAAKLECPATGLWSECAVFQRLERSGLAPRRDSAAAATESPLTARGIAMQVGRADLELYFYPDVASRERDERKLDRTKYIDYGTAVSMAAQETLIHSANLLAILHSRNDHLRERVGDALTAGPPQPPNPK